MSKKNTEAREPLLGSEAQPKENKKTKIAFDPDDEILFERKSATSSYVKLANVSRFRLIAFFIVIVLLYLLYSLLTTDGYSNHSNHFLAPHIASDEYLIYTNSCKLKNWPVFDSETRPIFSNVSKKSRLCTKRKFNINIVRHNYTWISISIPGQDSLNGWNCFGRELVRIKKNDRWDYGLDGFVGPLGKLYNFDREVMATRTKQKSVQMWDAVEVMCNKTQSEAKKQVNWHAVPLIQHYHPKEEQVPTEGAQVNRIKPNILLLGVDSISRLNFLRHFTRTQALMDKFGFIPLYGYHKVGENSFPNIFPMMTGHQVEEYVNDTTSKDFRFDSTPLIFYDFNKHGYLTTFIEDMPSFGFFTYGKPGFLEQPTHYYLRPFNFAIHSSLYTSYSCYEDKLECEIYYEYIIDQLKAFRERGNQPHFVFNQISSLTHDYINHAGYADRPYSELIGKIFDGGFNRNTVIFLYSDHGLRFGDILRTQSGIYEQRLPFFYMYIPDELKLNGFDSRELRSIIKVNQRRLTSHIDLHATMLHLIHGKLPEKEPYSRSLFTEIPMNRTCKQAGIADNFCMCNAYIRMRWHDTHDRISKNIVDQINKRMIPHQGLCEELTFKETLSISTPQSEIKLNSEHHYMIQFKTQPNGGLYESTVLVSGNVNDKKAKIKVEVIGDISRIDKYGHQTKCVLGLNKIERFCYCRDLTATAALTTTQTPTTTSTAATTTNNPTTSTTVQASSTVTPKDTT